jgi:hypothetical protein
LLFEFNLYRYAERACGNGGGGPVFAFVEVGLVTVFP